MYKYNAKMAKYRRDLNSLAVSDNCAFYRILNPEHLYLECESSVKVHNQTAQTLGIVISDLGSKGYETLIYKQN